MGREVKRSREVAESSKKRARMRVESRKKRDQRRNCSPEGGIVEAGAGERGEEVKARNTLAWLPRGWILEIKTRLSGDSKGNKYKCYFDPFSGSRFYSKAEVLRFLKSGNINTPTSGEKRHFKTSVADNVLAQIEYSPDGLPHGWIKETKFRKSKSNIKGIRRDPYYIDPVSGYVFRSLKDANHYAETGELGNYAFGPRKSSISEMYSLEKESPLPIPVKELELLGPTIQKCLFTEEASTSNGERAIEIDESPDKLLLPPPDHASSKSFQKADPTSSPDLKQMEGNVNEKRRKVLEAATDNSLHAPKHGEQKAKRGSPTIEMPRPAGGSGEMVVDINESCDKLQLQPPDHASFKSFQKADSTSSPVIEHMEEKADNKRRKGLEAATDDSLNTSKSGEQKAKRGRPAKENRSRPEKDKKGTEELTEPTAITEKLSEPTNERTPVLQERKQRKSKDKSVSLPRRSSKRLAGLEPAPATDLVFRRPSHKPLSNGGCNGIEETVPLAEAERMGTAEEVSQGAHVLLTEQTSEDRPSSPPAFALPFGDSWSDPCIEFAIKTLMGEIPVLDEGIAIEEYVQKQLRSAEASNHSAASATVASDNQALDPAKLLGPVELPKERRVHVNGGGERRPLENGMPSHAEASRVQS